MRKVWLGVCTMGAIGAALLYAKEGEVNQRSTGQFSEYKYQTSHPSFPNKPNVGEPFSENKAQKGVHVESPFNVQQDAKTGLDKTATPAPVVTNPSPAAAPTATPAQVNSALQQTYPNLPNWFNANWWANHGVNPNFNPGANWWAGANWATAGQWAGAQVAAPVFYDPNGTTSTPVPSSATNTDTTLSKPIENWMPLGVYAIGTEATDPSNATAFIQLAADNQGVITGTYFDTVADKVQVVQGTYDKATQAVTLQIAGMPDSPIIQTGLYNLTENQTPVHVIMPDTSEQIWSFVKMQK